MWPSTTWSNTSASADGLCLHPQQERRTQTKPSYPVNPKHEPYAAILKKDNVPEGQVSAFEWTDEFGVKQIYVTAFLKGGDWLLVYQQRVSDAFSDFQRALRVTMVVLALGLLVILTTAFLLSKRMVAE